MKVLHVCESLIGGPASYLEEILPYQTQQFGADNVVVLAPANQRSALASSINCVVETYELHPDDLGLAASTVQDLRGGTPDESAVMMRDLLGKKLNGARRDTVLLNAAAALAAETGDFKSALEEVQDSLDSGQALAKLNALVEYSQAFQTIQ